MAHHERVTFTQGREVLEHAIRHLEKIGDALDTLQEGDHAERVGMLLTSVTREQRGLQESIDRFMEDAPDKVLDTYAQYTVELPTDVGAPESPLTTLSLTQWLVGHNAHLYEMFSELAGNAPSREIGEVFDGIARQVQAHDRRLSKEYQRFEDL
jgi:hypothetical protein